jgi:hypothetical protein
VPHVHHPARGEQPVEGRDRRPPGRVRQVDEQVPAEHRVVGRLAAQKARVGEVADPEPDPRPNRVPHRPPVGDPGEMPPPRGHRLRIAKRRVRVDADLPDRHRPPAHIHRVHPEAPGGQPGVEQGQGHAVRLLPGAARDAQYPQRPADRQRPAPLGRPPGQVPERLRVPQEPRLRHHHRFHQRVQFPAVGLHLGRVLGGVPDARRIQPPANGRVQHPAADRAGVQPEVPFEQVGHRGHATASR